MAAAAEPRGRMSGRSPSCGLPPPAMAQPPGGGHLHPFGSGADGEGPEEEVEVYELRPRGREKVRRSTSRDRLDDIVLLTKDIQEGDTLNAIALQYCCSGMTARDGADRLSWSNMLLLTPRDHVKTDLRLLAQKSHVLLTITCKVIVSHPLRQEQVCSRLTAAPVSAPHSYSQE
uniref:LysM domain containing 3 n=1 Tax=Apteryx owenii TaxID=8824 RepID=A0A8B9Q0W6_APTOW